jgi:hypothetical protein
MKEPIDLELVESYATNDHAVLSNIIIIIIIGLWCESRPESTFHDDE